MKTSFQPDYRHIEAVMANRRPARLPLYEHLVNPESIEQILGITFSDLLASDDPGDLAEFFRLYCDFFKRMTFDTVSFEICIGSFIGDHSAICGGAGPIQTRDDFNNFPWEEIPGRFWKHAIPRFDALREVMPAGMKAIGGIGNGVFELAEAFTGLEYLPFMDADDPELHAALYNKIGDLMHSIWSEFLKRYKNTYVACRFGDDLGFKSSLLTHPDVIRNNIIPQYRRIINAVHNAGKPFLLHSCGNIFEVMDDFIDIGIDAKHSNEDAIAPFQTWIDKYSSRIGLFGGFDLDFLCLKTPADITASIAEKGARYRATANGYALGSGNSIPSYVPAGNFLAMVEGVQIIRKKEE
jgi:uroporphyrinogen decarboxylase